MISNSSGQTLVEALIMLATILLFLVVTVNTCLTGIQAVQSARYAERTHNAR